ncbi:hypothetical protein CRUP_026704 [Coryphaenoides rupestris]|nr:hypothetical protein CRUP_026704 [Coryphaenoides rupestris]
MLSKKEKELIVDIWTQLTPYAETIGAEALLRMMSCYPGTKTYFRHLDTSPRSVHLLSHGRKVFLALADGSKDIDNLLTSLAALQTYHAYQLRIQPTNFKLLSHCMLVTLACHMGEDFTPSSHAAMDKFLSAFSAVLAEKCLIVYPWTQRYFGSFGNLYSAQTIIGNPLIAKHGAKIVHGLDRALKNMDDIKNTYTELSELHSEKLHVDPDNFRLLADCMTLLADCMTVCIAAKMGNAFTIPIQAAWQKFMCVVVSALGRQYH